MTKNALLRQADRPNQIRRPLTPDPNLTRPTSTVQGRTDLWKPNPEC